MNNLLRTDVPLHRKFDLKGSTYGRSAGPDAPPTSVHKDLDVDMRLQLPSDWYQRCALDLPRVQEGKRACHMYKSAAICCLLLLANGISTRLE